MSYNQNNYNNGGYNQGNQGDYNQGNGQNGQRRNSGFDNLATITIVGRMVNDPESKIVGNSKVANSKIAVNHRSEKAGTDFWFVEVWGNEGSDSKHNFFVNHCAKGRRVLITGTPELRQQQGQDGSYTYYPTIRALEVLGLDGGSDNARSNNQQQSNQPPTGQFNQGGYNQQQAPQGGYQPQQQGGFPPNNQQAAPGGFPPAQNNNGGGFPANPPGGGYGAPVGVPVGAPNSGGFPPTPVHQ